jgi:hypothetical protein
MGEANEEYVLPLLVPRSSVHEVSVFRSTWVTSSIQALQKRGIYGAYAAQLAPADLQAIAYCAPASWLDAQLVVRHYEACDRLALPTDTLLEIGADVTQRVHASALALGRSVAAASNMTPWTILHRFDKLWARVAVGGAVGVAKLGPKEARVELLGFPVAKIRYNRVATRGILRGMVGLFCNSVWVHELPALCSQSTLGYRIQWA